MVLTSCETFGKNTPETTAMKAAIIAYSTMSWPRSSLHNPSLAKKRFVFRIGNLLFLLCCAQLYAPRLPNGKRVLSTTERGGGVLAGVNECDRTSQYQLFERQSVAKP